MNKKTVPDYYAILGVPQNASLEEIRLAYRQRARSAHPDLNSDPEAEARFRRINEAYEVLANPEKRKAYDYFVANTDVDETEESAAPESAGIQAPSSGPTAEAIPDAEEPERRSVSPPTWALLLILMGALVILAIIASGLLSLRENRPTGGATSLDVNKRSTFTSPPPISDDRPVVETDDTPLRTQFPDTLQVAGEVFPVIAVEPEQGRWPLPDQDGQVALWVHGTVVNYVFGIPYSDTIESQLAGLSSRDRITLTMESGTDLVFGAPKTQRMDADDLSPMAQDQPGLTLMTIGSDNTYVLVQARHLPGDIEALDDRRAGNLTVELLESGLIDGDEPPWAYLIEYRVTNRGDTVVDPSRFDMILEADDGQRFSLNADVTAEGLYGRPTAPLEPDTEMRGSAGYILPSDIAMPLTWIFRADPNAEDAARHVLAFEKPGPEPARPYVELSDAFLDEDRNVIVISGRVANRGETPLQVTAEDVSLTSQTGQSTLETASPLLPWNIQPDAEQPFELQFTRPTGTDSALLNVLGFTFEIEGLN